MLAAGQRVPGLKSLHFSLIEACWQLGTYVECGHPALSIAWSYQSANETCEKTISNPWHSMSRSIYSWI